MEAIYRLSKEKMNNVATGLNFPDPVRGPITRDQVVEELVQMRLPRRRLHQGKVRQRRVEPGHRPEHRRRDRHLHRRGVHRGQHRRQRVSQDGVGHEDGDRRLRRCRLHHDGRLRLSRRRAPRRRDEGLPRGTLHGRGARVRRAHGKARDDVRVQRRLALEQRRDRQLGRGPRQGRVGERQSGHGGAVFLGLQPAYAGRTRAAAHERGTDGRATSAARLLLGGRQRRACRHARREQREPARPNAAPELHGTATATKA